MARRPLSSLHWLSSLRWLSCYAGCLRLLRPLSIPGLVAILAIVALVAQKIVIYITKMTENGCRASKLGSFGCFRDAGGLLPCSFRQDWLYRKGARAQAPRVFNILQPLTKRRVR